MWNWAVVVFFLMCLWKCLMLCPLLIFPHKPYSFYCAILHGMMIIYRHICPLQQNRLYLISMGMTSVFKHYEYHGLGISNLTHPELNSWLFLLILFYPQSLSSELRDGSVLSLAQSKNPRVILESSLHLTPHSDGMIFRMYHLSTSSLLPSHWVTLIASKFISFLHFAWLTTLTQV